MSERDRLAEIMAEAWLRGAALSPRGSWCTVADALLASEEWQAREAVVAAARRWAILGDEKTCHVRTCKECERLEE